MHEIDFQLCNSKSPNEVCELLNGTVLFGGKRLRPLLVLLSNHFLGDDRDGVTDLAISVEHVHAASLAHDDVIDNATVRRGRESINIVGSNKRAVLSGDFLLADVISRLASLDSPAVLKEMSRVIKDLSHGEWLQIEAASSKDVGAITPESVAVKKTGSLISFALCAPAILSGDDHNVVEALRSVGVNIGVSFQLTDDLLDFSPNSGKEIGIDLDNGVLNSVLFELFKINPEYYKKLVSKEVKLDLGNDDLVESVNRVRVRANELLSLANNELEALAISRKVESEKVRPLVELFSMLGKRTF